MATDTAAPIPFDASRWPAGQREAVSVLQAWRASVETHTARALRDSAACVAAEEALLQGRIPEGIDERAYLAARAACEAHGVPVEWLARQVRAAWAFGGPAAFPDWEALQGFADDWAGSYGVILARLAGATGRWQEPSARSLATGFFIVGRLLTLPADAAAGRIFIAASDLEKGGVSVEALREGRPDEALRRVLWKQLIRARDAFAQGQELIRDLSRPYRGELKRTWLGALAVLDEVERRKFDLWTRPITLTPIQRFQLRIQAIIGKGASRKR
ncbi:MAG: squalene/phytoene synthase family protein [Rhodothermales bacterium]